jgi:hypothetical protein
MKTVKGIWTFKDVLTNNLPALNYGTEKVNFKSNGENFEEIGNYGGAAAPVKALSYGRYDNGDLLVSPVYFFEEDASYGIEAGWDVGNVDIEAYKTIDFGETEQPVTDEFYAWLTRNAFAEKVEINITENGTTTLATAGKYCYRNIDVNVEVEDSGAEVFAGMAQGTIEGEFASNEVTALRDYAFYRCEQITALSFPNCITVGASAFQYAKTLESVSLPSLTTITGISCFYNTKIKELYLPNLTTIDLSTNICRACYSLTTVNLPKLSGTTIGARAFSGCSHLTTVILGGSVLNPLGDVNAFHTSPIADGNGYIYVPDNLVNEYKQATNWVTYASQIKSINELEV